MMQSDVLYSLNSEHFQTISSICLLSLIHLFANRLNLLGWVWHGRFLSFASGVSFAYVFVSLLPELANGEESLAKAVKGFFPYLERHVYLVALCGFLFFYGLQSVPGKKIQRKDHLHFWVSMSGYSIFNLLIGSAISDPDNPDVKPLYLFTLAMGLHYFVNDHNLFEIHREDYENKGRWILTGALIIGWFLGTMVFIPDALIALLVSFAAGGVLLNVMRYELPEKQNKGGFIYFSAGAISYSAMLLAIGEKTI